MFKLLMIGLLMKGWYANNGMGYDALCYFNIMRNMGFFWIVLIYYIVEIKSCKK